MGEKPRANDCCVLKKTGLMLHVEKRDHILTLTFKTNPMTQLLKKL
jgi:hypothetical protein